MLRAEPKRWIRVTAPVFAQEAVFEQPALQIVFELLADEPGQVTAGAFDLLHEAWVMFSNE